MLEEQDDETIEKEYKDSLEKIGIEAAKNIYEMFKIYAKYD